MILDSVRLIISRQQPAGRGRLEAQRLQGGDERAVNGAEETDNLALVDYVLQRRKWRQCELPFPGKKIESSKCKCVLARFLFETTKRTAVY